MAWLETYTATNKVTDEVSSYTHVINFFSTTPKAYKRTVTVSVYRYVGMTEATAIAGAIALNDHGEEGALTAPSKASARRSGEGGNWEIAVQEWSYTDWAEIVPA